MPIFIWGRELAVKRTSGVSQVSLQQRMLVMMVGLLGLLVVLSVGIGYTIAQRDAATRETARVIEPARESLMRLLEGLGSEASGLRGYLLSRDPLFLDSYREGAAVVDQERSRLARLLGEVEALDRPVDDVLAEVRAWRQEVVRPQLALAEDGRFEEATQLVSSGAGEQRLQQARSAIAELRAALVARQSESGAAAAVAGRRLTALVIVTLVGGFAHVVASGWLLRRWVTSPLNRVAQAATAVAEGARHDPVPVTGPRDVARLARAVEFMRATIVGLLDDAVRARAALEQQGEAVLLFRQELAASGLALPPGVGACGHLRANEGLLAGDWYDILPREDGSVTPVVVDVSGHGTQAGVQALRAKYLLEAAVRSDLPPGEALAWLATGMGHTDEDFLTAIIADVDLHTNVCRYANAGHPPGVMVCPSGQSRLLEPTGPLLGPLPGSWSTETILLEPGVVLLLYTDGLVEARNEHGEMFGTDRLVEVAEGCASDGPDAVVQACVDAVTTFTGGRLTDDVTAVALAPHDHVSGPARRPKELPRSWIDALGM